MPIRLLRDGTYDRKPWKNGGGITEDVWLFPEGASHDDFDIRLSLAEISARVGYANSSTLSRLIRRETNTTAQEFRRRMLVNRG